MLCSRQASCQTHRHGLLASTVFGTASSNAAATAFGSPGRGRLLPGPKSPGPGTSTNLLLACIDGWEREHTQ